MPPPHHPLADLDEMVAEVARWLDDESIDRYLLGITGPPGAGKSTVAERVAATAPIPACVAPMDGFHRRNEDLRAAGLLALKGIPETFDAEGFVARLSKVRHRPDETIVWPTYDRNLQEVVPSGHVIRPSDRLVVVEGNYLLVDEPPWHEVRPLLDAVWYIDVPRDVLVPRLLERHGRDRSQAGAAEKVASTDLPNAELVAATQDRADVVLRCD